MINDNDILEDYFSKFLLIEHEFDLFNKKIDNVYFWERIRNLLLRQHIFNTINYCHPKIKKNFSIILLFIFNSIISFFEFIFLKIKKNKIVFWGHPRRKFLDDNKWWDIYCDPYIDNFNQNDYLYLEEPYLYKHFKPAKTLNIQYLDYIYFFSAVLRKLKIVNIKLSENDLKLINKIQSKINDVFNCNINLKNIIVHDLYIRKSRIGLYKILLKKIEPKFLILVGSPGLETLIEVCKILNIKTIELQHGIISKVSLGYLFPKENRVKRTFPDYLFTFGNFWKNIDGYPISKNNIFSIGFPYFEKESKKYSNIKKKKQIIFISQSTIGKKLSKLAVEIAESNLIDYILIYKLHPWEYPNWKNNYPWLNKKNISNQIKVIENDSIPLYKIMAESTIQIGVYSTAIYEGLYFGLKTYLLDVYGLIYIDYLIKFGIAKKIRNINDFISKLQNEINPIAFKTDYFFKCNSNNNFFKAINCIDISINLK